MRLVFIIFSTILASLQVNSQDFKDFNPEMILKSNNIRPYLTEEQISGSPYLNKQFIAGTIIQTDDTEIRDIPLRYNIFSRKMQFKRNGTILDIYETNKIKRIILGDKFFVYAPYNDSKKIRLSYFQVMNSGKFQLLKMYNVIYKGSGEKPEISDSSRFEHSLPNYYLRYNNGTANLINSQKKLIKILQPIPQEITDYIIKNNIKTNNEIELIDLLEYINKEMN